MPTSADYGRSSCRIVCYGLLDRRLYVREKNVITFEGAVRKMSSFPAARMGLHEASHARSEGGPFDY